MTGNDQELSNQYQKKLSIIIVNWNTRDLLAECLDSVFHHLRDQFSYEVIVIDNASVDGSTDMVEEKFPQARLIKNDDNVGFVKANNQGAKIANGRYLLLLNSDTVLLDGEMWKIIEYMDANQDVAVTTGRVLNPDMSFQRPFRRFPNWIGSIWRNTMCLVKGLETWFHKRYMLEELDENEEQEVDWVSGAYMFVRRDVLDNGHVFDEDIYMWFEDTLLCYSLRKAGYRVVYLPYAPIIHYKGKSAGKIPVKAAFNSFRGSTIYFQKVYGRPLARFYATTVRLIWALFALCFSILEFVPNEKIKEKAQLFRRLIAMGPAI